MSSPELFRIIGQQSWRSMTDDDIAALSYDEKSSMLRNDPVLAARHSDHRLKAFFKDVLVGASALGPVRQHFYRIKFQMRGSPHAHCLLWTADGSDMSKATAEEIEPKVSGQLPPVEDPLHALVDRVQRHTHSVANTFVVLDLLYNLFSTYRPNRSCSASDSSYLYSFPV